MPKFWRENSLPVLASVGLHGLLLLAVILISYVASQQRLPAVHPIPVDAVAIDSRVLRAAQHEQAEAAQELARANAAAQQAAETDAAAAAARAAEQVQPSIASVPENEAAAKADSAADSAANAAAAAVKAAAAEQQRAAAEQQRAASASAEKAAAAAQAVLDAQRAAETRKALAAKLAAEARAAEERAAKERDVEVRQAAKAKQAQVDRLAAEAKQALEARKAAEAKQAADAKRAADERAKQEREAELRRQLADEEHVSAVESGPLRDRYITLLRNKIQQAWIKPPSATAGVDCLVQVTQVPGGEVTGARVTQCNGDAALRQSIENAVYRASPLPDPPDPALFERNLSLRFRPND